MSGTENLLRETLVIVRRGLYATIDYRTWSGPAPDGEPVPGSYRGDRDEIDYKLDLVRRVEDRVGRPEDGIQPWLNEIIDGTRDL